MTRGPALLPLILAAAACGSGEQAAGDARPTPGRMTLTSTAFEDGGSIPSDYTCEGKDHPPPLAWSGAPPTTKSFVLIVSDPDAPGGTFRHWGAYDIPSTATSPAGGAEAVNDMGKPGYSGPCPPPGHGLHHYRFTLMALDVAKLGLPSGSKIAAVEAAANAHAIATGQLTGTYERR